MVKEMMKKRISSGYGLLDVKTILNKQKEARNNKASINNPNTKLNSQQYIKNFVNRANR